MIFFAEKAHRTRARALGGWGGGAGAGVRRQAEKVARKQKGAERRNERNPARTLLGVCEGGGSLSRKARDAQRRTGAATNTPHAARKPLGCGDQSSPARTITKYLFCVQP